MRGASPAWAARAAEGLVGAIPSATRLTLAGQDHGVDHGVLAPVLVEFFEEGGGSRPAASCAARPRVVPLAMDEPRPGAGGGRPAFRGVNCT
jgi:hypothetical protein